MDLGIEGKRALVLASSQGLGLGIATRLCEEGARVMVCGRVEEKLQGVAKDLNDNYAGTAEYVVADLSDPGSLQSMVPRKKNSVASIFS